jgi:histidyl-tRNA synthetase
MGYRGNLKRRMERANKIAARVALILGETEAAAATVQFRDLDAGSQETVAQHEAVLRLTS